MIDVMNTNERQFVTPRERRVSRNFRVPGELVVDRVTPRERRVSRNKLAGTELAATARHASREACE